jgi:hypothetical protein
VIQRKGYAYEFQIEFKRKRAKIAHQDKYRLKEILRVTKYSEGRSMQRVHQKTLIQSVERSHLKAQSSTRSV